MILINCRRCGCENEVKAQSLGKSAPLGVVRRSVSDHVIAGKYSVFKKGFIIFTIIITLGGIFTHSSASECGRR